MSLGMQLSAKAAKSTVRAARKAMSKRLGMGQARARDVVDASGRRADHSLEAVESALIGVVDAISQRKQAYAKAAKGRIYATEARLFPRPRSRPFGTALVGLGAGVLLSLLLAPRAAKVEPPRQVA